MAILIYSAFIVACVVSFRSLWTNRRQNNKKHRIELERQQAMMFAQQRHGSTGSFAAMRKPSSMRNRWDNLLDTLADLEGTTLERNGPKHLRFTVPSPSLAVDFSRFGIAQRATSKAKSSHSSPGNRGSSVEYDSLDSSEYLMEPQGRAGEYDLLQHPEPLPSYHRPGTAV